MQLTFNLELDFKANKKGEKLLMIRCSQLGKHKRINTGIHLLPKYWDKDKKLVRKNHPLASDLNITIAKKVQEIEEQYLGLMRENKTVSLSDMLLRACFRLIRFSNLSNLHPQTLINPA